MAVTKQQIEEIIKEKERKEWEGFYKFYSKNKKEVDDLILDIETFIDDKIKSLATPSYPPNHRYQGNTRIDLPDSFVEEVRKENMFRFLYTYIEEKLKEAYTGWEKVVITLQGEYSNASSFKACVYVEFTIR
jgi:hypothetical protein